MNPGIPKINFWQLQDTLFLPACTGDGRYEQVQCYRSTGYCWCVNEDTGKPIPGTSMKDKRPQCDSHTPDRSMPGCPQKNEFLKDLKDFLKTQINSGANVGWVLTNLLIILLKLLL